MQKKIIALAVAAAFSAPAFADVTAYGVVDATLARVSADKQKSDMQVLSGGLSTSRFGVKTVEDLNNGMKAVVVLEYALDSVVNASVGADADTLAGKGFKARQQMLAVAGDFGTFATGYLQTAGYDWAVKFDPTAGSAVSPLQNVTKGGKFLIGSAALGARAQRALAYISPDMSGVTVAVNYSTALDGLGDLTVADTVPVQSKSTAYLLSATYTGVQNLTVGAVYANATLGTSSNALGTGALAGETSTLSVTEMALGASYDLGVAKLFATYQKRGNGTNNVIGHDFSNKALSFSAVAPVGPGAVVFTYAKNNMDTAGAASANGKGMTVAWLQGLSKTTTMYAAYSKMSQDTAANSYSVLNDALAPAMAGGEASNVLAVGLKKTF